MVFKKRKLRYISLLITALKLICVKTILGKNNFRNVLSKRFMTCNNLGLQVREKFQLGDKSVIDYALGNLKVVPAAFLLVCFVCLKEGNF